MTPTEIFVQAFASGLLFGAWLATAVIRIQLWRKSRSRTEKPANSKIEPNQALLVSPGFDLVDPTPVVPLDEAPANPEPLVSPTWKNVHPPSVGNVTYVADGATVVNVNSDELPYRPSDKIGGNCFGEH